MKTTKIVILAVLISLSFGQLNAQKSIAPAQYRGGFIPEQALLDYNNISTWIHNTGTFNQDLTINNFPGFMWPKGSNKFALFTTGFTTAAYVNGQLLMAAASYTGEYRPGTVISVNGTPTPYTDSTFKLYKVSKGDNCSNNPDWANWGLMIPYGAPYDDVNSNGQYDPCIDIPGVKGAGQTIFVCMTDAFPESHTSAEGFGGGTAPLNAELRLTAWAYESKIAGTQDAQFLKFQVINKNNSQWDSTRFSIFCDPDLGDATDDWVGCDTIRQIGYCYNSTNDDGTGTGITYGQNPPAVGIRMLRSVKNKWSPDAEYFGMNGFCYIGSPGGGGSVCEIDPGTVHGAYNFMMSLKNDGTSWINPISMQKTKFTYPGNVESGAGWTEQDGKINNCWGIDTGSISPSPGGNRTFVLSTGRDDLTINPLDTQEVIITQLMARGSNNLNSVTKLLSYSDAISNIFNYVYIDPLNITISNSEIPAGYFLSNNYPNPFNPVTKIDYSIPKEFDVNITVYDILGNEVAVLHNGIQKAGNYSIQFNGSSLASGIYFLKMKSGSFIQTRKMALLK